MPMNGTWVKILFAKRLGHSPIYIRKCPVVLCAILLAQSRHRKMSVMLIYQLIRCQYSACGYCPCETSEYDLVVIHQAVYCADIGKCLLKCFQIFNTLYFSIKLSDIGKCLRSGASCSPTETDVCCLAYSHVCFIHRFQSAVQLRSQCLPFSILDRRKTM